MTDGDGPIDVGAADEIADMAPKTYKCPRAGCGWSEELEPEVGPIWLRDHLDTVHAVAPKAKPPPLPLPPDH